MIQKYSEIYRNIARRQIKWLNNDKKEVKNLIKQRQEKKKAQELKKAENIAKREAKKAAITALDSQN